MPETTRISENTILTAADTLAGDITSFLIDNLRNLEAAYRYLDEEHQRDLIATAKRNAETMIREAVRLIAADGRDVIPVSIKKVVNDGEKIQVTIEANRSNTHRHSLFDAAGFSAVLTVADPEKYMGGEEPEPEPNQPDLLGTAQTAE